MTFLFPNLSIFIYILLFIFVVSTLLFWNAVPNKGFCDFILSAGLGLCVSLLFFCLTDVIMPKTDLTRIVNIGFTTNYTESSHSIKGTYLRKYNNYYIFKNEATNKEFRFSEDVLNNSSQGSMKFQKSGKYLINIVNYKFAGAFSSSKKQDKKTLDIKSIHKLTKKASNKAINNIEKLN